MSAAFVPIASTTTINSNLRRRMINKRLVMVAVASVGTGACEIRQA